MPKFKYITDMRGNLGVDLANVTACDAMIAKMSPLERLRLICGWNIGDREWANSFIEWAKDAGFEVREK